MNISAGLVGLPNVGKSTLFNTITRSSVPAENYPFCTIDPHLACTIVPDERMQKLQDTYKSGKQIPASMQFVDIAGLVKGAASGEGLGNQFLSHIREVHLILHVLRCFEDPNITRAEGIDPLGDYEIILSELMLKDVESVEKRAAKNSQLMKSAKNDPKALKVLQTEADLIAKLQPALNSLDLANVQKLLKENPGVLEVPLLVDKDFLILANMAESDMAGEEYQKNAWFQKLVTRFGAERVIPVSARLEHELSLLNDADKKEMRDMLGITFNSMDAIIAQSYKHLGLITFFTCGPKEIHAWPIRKGLTIRQAAGEIHSDLERGFICADIFNCEDIFAAGSEAKLKDVGKLRTEGQDYIVKDGDVVHVKFNV